MATTVLGYAAIAALIGVPVGFLFGLLFGTLVSLEGTLKEGIAAWLTITILTPIFLFMGVFVMYAWFSIFLENLKLW